MSEMSNEQVLSRCQEIVDNIARSQNIERENHLSRIMSAVNVVLPKKIVDYVLLSASENHELREKVINGFSKGYDLYGDPILTLVDGCDAFYCQAMVKYEE